MSATFRLAKKKYTQNDLRRLMHEQKTKIAQKVTTKIDSPLAKYNDLGQLMCILCKSVVRSEDVWKVHINAKQHKQNIELAKQLREKTNNFTVPAVPPATNKRSAPPIESDVPTKVRKSILKNSGKSTTADNESHPVESGLPKDFFDNSAQSSSYFKTTLKKTSIKAELVNIKRGGTDSEKNGDGSESMDIDQAKDDALPEGFFDDPKKDAKARNSDYKDPVEEEWEKFQQEIKEASHFSNAIIAEDQEEATTERQIDEIDEQIRNWSRVLELEKKKELVYTKHNSGEIDIIIGKTEKCNVVDKGKSTDDGTDSDSDDNEIGGDIDEYLDWRAKKAYE